IPLVLLGGLIIWRLRVNARDKASQIQAASARKKAAPAVRVAPAVVRDIVHAFEGIGDVEAPADVKVGPKVTGRLIYLELREGAHVKMGQVLARLDPAEIQAAINQQRANVGSAEANANNAQIFYRRNYSLYKQGFIAAQDVDNARTQREVQ